MTPEIIFVIVWGIVMTSMITKFLVDGKRALSIFPNENTVQIVFREKRASGNTLHKNILKRGSASRVLDVIITNSEVWIKAYRIFAGMAKKTGMLHKLPFEKIVSARMNHKKVDLTFISEQNETTTIQLMLKKPNDFIDHIEKIKLKKQTT